MVDAGEREYYTVAQAANVLRVSRTTVWRWIVAGRLDAYRIGPRTIRVRKGDIEALPRPTRTKSANMVSEPMATYEAEPANIWANYNPEKAKAAWRTARGILAGVDIEALKRDIREARGQDSKGRPAN